MEEKKKLTPYVPASSTMAEMTFKALFLGVVLALIFGAANAYIGMKAGLTISAVFPAAVMAMAILRPMRGTILEENMARTTGVVGESLIAGAIFTIPAFILAGVWAEFDFWKSVAIMIIGGLLGSLFIVILRRTLVVESDLPFPESMAASEMVKAGQKGATGAAFVFGAMGLGALWELLKNGRALHLIQENVNGFLPFAKSSSTIGEQTIEYQGGVVWETPSASPMLCGVGYIVGPRISAVLFSGAVLGWGILVPAAVYLNPSLTEGVAAGGLLNVATEVWLRQIRPLAVGTMIVAAFYTLYNLRGALITGIGRAIRDIRGGAAGAEATERTDRDLNFKAIFACVVLIAIPICILYYVFSGDVGGAILLTFVMIILGFFFAAVAGYLVGLIGASNNPVSGLTLSSLLVAALLMVALGITGPYGIAAVLGVAGVICCAAAIAGGLMQDLKVGQILGGTPWKMELGEIVGIVCAASAMVPLMAVLHRTYTIGSAELPAPQAGLMALMAEGILEGNIAWPLVLLGMLLAVCLILIKAPSPMLIAVGMYLPFYSTSAIFVGGIIKWIMESRMRKQEASEEEQQRAQNVGLLVSSGLIAGESLMAVIVAIVLGIILATTPAGMPEPETIPFLHIEGVQANFWWGLIIYPVLLGLLIWLPMKKMKESGISAAKME